MLSCCHSTSAVFHAGSVDFSFQLIKEDIEVVFSVFYLISFNYLLIRKKKKNPVAAPVWTRSFLHSYKMIPLVLTLRTEKKYWRKWEYFTSHYSTMLCFLGSGDESSRNFLPVVVFGPSAQICVFTNIAADAAHPTMTWAVSARCYGATEKIIGFSLGPVLCWCKWAGAQRKG